MKSAYLIWKRNGSMARVGLALLSLTAGLCLFALTMGCGSSSKVEELKNQIEARDRRIQALEAERAEFEKKTRELEQSLHAAQAKPAVQAAPQPAEDPCDARLAQLRATLNKAYLDIKIALVERDEFKRKLAALQAQLKDKSKP
jgi:cell division protein FtsB